MSLLVVGSTGTLGRQIVRKALSEGFQVKCFVRNFRKASFLKEWGAELVYGDLALPETIPIAMYGITAIIDASTTRINDSYNAEQIDCKSKYILIESAIQAKIDHYIFFSILNNKNYSNIPLINLKLLIEQKLSKSNLNYTIFHLPGFFQGLIPQYAIPLLDQKSIWITNESKCINYINTQDIAKIVITSLSINKSKNKTFKVLGNKAWTSLEIIKLCEKISGKRAIISTIPINILNLLRQFFRLFKWTSSISERLAFTEILSEKYDFNNSMEDVSNVLKVNVDEIESLETYLQEYFFTIMKKLKELNYQDVKDNEF